MPDANRPEQRRLTESAVGEWLDANGLHHDARGPGCYAVELREPSSNEFTILVEWLATFDADPPGNLLERLAEAERFAYVGSHGKSVYERICQHARGEKSATIMDVWPPVGVIDVWPETDPRDHEYGYALDLADDSTACWTDGELL